MEYNFKGIPLGRQGRRRDCAKVGVLKLVQRSDDMMKLLILLLFIIAAVLIWFWIRKIRSKSENENPVYLCPECGDHHCNCYLEEKDK
jgi:hypothetical protein